MKEQEQTPLLAPIATSVTIMGEPMPGATVRGSYLYSGTGDEAQEGRSLGRWYINEVPHAYTEDLDLVIYQSMVGQKIRFAITPVSDSGVSGIEVYSESQTVFRGYQNISEEENANSYIKQFGAFSLYKEEPPDRILTSTSGAFAIKSGVTQSVVVKGRADQGGTPPPEIAQYLKNNPATRMFASGWDFGALVPVLGSSNRLLVWGPHIPNPIPPTLDMSNIQSVYANESSIAWIHKDPPPGKNTIGAIGPAANGGVVPEDVQRSLLFDKPKAIYATAAAFTVLTEGGRVHSWGHATSGGLIPDATKIVLNQLNISSIVCSAGAFCAIGSERFGDPSIKTLCPWGGAASGGALNPGDLEKIMDQDGVKHVIANRDSFVVITKRRSQALSWGGAYGGQMNDAARALSARGNIVMCAGAAYAFAMVNTGGESAAWGALGFGGKTSTSEKGTAAAEDEVDAEAVFEASGAKEQIRAAFKQLRVAELYERQSENPGGDCSCQSTGKKPSSLTHLVTSAGDIELLANDMSFFMLVREGGYTADLINWGHASFGGLIPAATRQVLMASQITGIYSTNGAYATISAQGGVKGAVNAFGGTTAQQDAGQIPENIQLAIRADVSEIYSIKRLPPYQPFASSRAAFSARLQNGTYAVWGSTQISVNEVLDPGKPQ
ncbi:hypothetical protein JFT66_17645 [Pseudomonas sp. MF6755]|uniref:hypothetical protein n=1 Tax=Pseudomonas sp. MF6755 TaxID=2797530 RepID=UPI0018E8AA67|nr:hypothetical protein [Pseudomonas sp. MF6755]MBJ2285982.1 hypothetical protein [Pseudomonas sp. MF6755]